MEALLRVPDVAVKVVRARLFHPNASRDALRVAVSYCTGTLHPMCGFVVCIGNLRGGVGLDDMPGLGFLNPRQRGVNWECCSHSMLGYVRCPNGERRRSCWPANAKTKIGWLPCGRS